MTTLKVALVALLLAGTTPALAAQPFEPIRKFMKDSGSAIRKALKVPQARPKSVSKPTKKEATDETPPASIPSAAVPNPRIRPDAEAMEAKAAAAELATDRAAKVLASKPDFDTAFAEDAHEPPATGSVPDAVPPAASGETATPPPAPEATAPDPKVAKVDPEVVPDLDPKAPPEPKAEATESAEVPIPHPRPRLASIAPDAELDPASPASRAPKARVAALPGLIDAGPGCAANLGSLGIVAKPMAAISNGTCGIRAPVAVASLESGGVTFTEKAVVNCAVAGAMAGWMRDDVQPAARKLLGGEVTSLRIAASYDCRGRNRDPKAQLSEHAFGNAIDISAFKVADRGWVVVGSPKGPMEAAFMNAIRKEACGPFTTVLGPGQAYHDEHFHFDLARRGRKGNSLYCK
jgi:hypothetical protein